VYKTRSRFVLFTECGSGLKILPDEDPVYLAPPGMRIPCVGCLPLYILEYLV
jgi:hypothetical protein